MCWNQALGKKEHKIRFRSDPGGYLDFAAIFCDHLVTILSETMKGNGLTLQSLQHISFEDLIMATELEQRISHTGDCSNEASLMFRVDNWGPGRSSIGFPIVPPGANELSATPEDDGTPREIHDSKRWTQEGVLRPVSAYSADLYPMCVRK